MPQITRIRIRGFQSHTNTDVLLGPGLTVITGPSDSGKTAIMRAIRWVAFGEPSGEAYINPSIGEAEVIISLDTGVEVTKLRKGGKTRHWVTGVTDPFEKAETPYEVKQALGLVQHAFGDFEAALNFSYQLDPPFMLSEAASVGAKVLGKIAGTEVVDLAIKGIAKDTYAARQERSQAEKEAEKIGGDLLQFHDLDDLKQWLDACEYLLGEVDTAYGKAQRLEGLHSDLHGAKEQLYQLGFVLDRLAIVPDIAEDLKHIEKAQQRYDMLLDLYSQYGKATATVAQLTEDLAKYEGLDAGARLMSDLEGVNQRCTSLSSLSTVYTAYTQEKSTAEERLAAIGSTEDVMLIMSGIGEDVYALESLYLLLSDHAIARTSLFYAGDALQALAGVTEAAAAIDAAEAKYGRQASLGSLRHTYEVYLGAIDICRSQVRDTTMEVGSWQAELSAAWEEVGGVCPLCDQPHEAGGQHAK